MVAVLCACIFALVACLEMMRRALAVAAGEVERLQRRTTPILVMLPATPWRVNPRNPFFINRN